MHRHHSWSESGVSEVVGTILILAMTVVLFSGIILWVSNFPTPQASIRLDMDGKLIPIYQAGVWKGVNVTVEHKGGESLTGFRTQVFFSVLHNGVTKTALLKTRGTSSGIPYGLNGPDADWDTGEVWSYTNYSVASNDKVTITVVDTVRSIVLWSETLTGPAGARPPLFLEKWEDRLPATPTIDTALVCQQFSLFAKVVDPDGDLNPNSVYVYLAFLYGTPRNHAPSKMYDDGTSGDAVARDGIFTANPAYFNPADLTWDGGVVIFNATDLQAHKSTSRMTLSVQSATCGPGGGVKQPPTGRPPNLNYNGLQGFNIFNGTEWDKNGFAANDTRTFTANQQVVVIVGSAIMKDLFGRNDFTMWDPYAFQPTPVVYGPNKNVGDNTKPSSTDAFSFLLFVNGYNVWIYRFELNNASVSNSCTPDGGICFKKTPSHPPEYYFGTYSVEFDLMDSQGSHFTATDAITIKDNDGTVRNYPQINFYRDSAYTLKTNTFNSTDNMWVAITMLDLDLTTSDVSFGTVEVRDFLGGTQIQKAFVNVEKPDVFNDVNSPLCPVALGSCTYGNRALSLGPPAKTYAFRVNLSRADQDPWVDGSQHYSLSIAFVHDVSSNELYAQVSAQLVIIAPLYRMDVVGGNSDTQNQAWGTHDYGYYYENLNGYDKFGKTRYEFCGLGGSCKNSAAVIAVKFLDGDGDGDLDIVACQQIDQNNWAINYYRRQIDSSGNVEFIRYNLWNGNLVCGSTASSAAGSDITTGDLTGDRNPDIVVGFSDGELWYFRNDGTWTTCNGACKYVVVDNTRTAKINDVTIG
ncbi:MAG TPA: type IV pilin N-terminal domain-containing protein, partial [Thermoplasmata archaeon]|nr:type IV pilin N-terminal domain-containing protein [Thermoplasmata archaeon]